MTMNITRYRRGGFLTLDTLAVLIIENSDVEPAVAYDIADAIVRLLVAECTSMKDMKALLRETQP